ncbi:MAG TPA: methyltransferase domain-containing protein [bacterium]|nr:methyltransferase domain-containing protein [bacterium]
MSSGVRWDAADYARSSSAQQGWALDLIARLGLSGSEAVLDVGCGDGKVTAELARLVPRGRVTGIDSSVDMVRLAQRSFPSSDIPNLEFELADARQLAFDRTFDVVFSNAVLHWVKDHRPVLRGISRCLRPSGKALLQMGGRGNAAEIMECARRLVETAEWSRWFQGFEEPWGFYGPEEYRAWCHEAGLEPRRVELLPRRMLQKGADGLAAWVRTTWMPYTQRLPEDRREPFIREVVHRYLQDHPPDQYGNVGVAMVRLEVEAVREGSSLHRP